MLVLIYRIDSCFFPCSFVGNLLAYTLAYISNKSINILNWLLPQLPLFCESLRLKFPHICCKSNRILWRTIWSSRFYDLFLSPAPNSEPRLCTEYQENILLSQWPLSILNERGVHQLASLSIELLPHEPGQRWSGPQYPKDYHTQDIASIPMRGAERKMGAPPFCPTHCRT